MHDGQGFVLTIIALAIIGGILALLMILLRGDFRRNLANTAEIVGDLLKTKGLGAINVDGVMVDVASIRILRNTILNKADLYGM